MHKRYSIGEASISCGLPIKTLRYYDEIDLMRPEYRDVESNYRYYSDKQLTTLLIIRRLRAQGFSLKDIKDLITNTSLPNMEAKIAQRCDDILNEINLLNVKMESCKSMLSRIHKGSDIVCKYSGVDEQLGKTIQIEDIPANKMIFSRELMKRYSNADVSLQRWTDIYEQCTALGIFMNSPVIVTFYSNALDQFLMKDCDVEFGVIVGNESAIPKEVTNIRNFGGHKAATAYHIGKYSEIMKSHVELLQWMHKNNYELDGYVSEEFVVSPLDVNCEEQYVTKIIMPIKKI